ncbi:MAG: hypothetical protein ACOZNI_09190 [Myxococcota bacterium]
MKLPPVVLLTDSRDPLASRAGVPVATRMWQLRGRVVHARVPVAELGRVALFSTLAGARAVIAAPIGEARPLPWWERRFHRYVLSSPEEAAAWQATGIHLGRLAVARPDPWEVEALRAIWTEVGAMSR